MVDIYTFNFNSSAFLDHDNVVLYTKIVFLRGLLNSNKIDKQIILVYNGGGHVVFQLQKKLLNLASGMLREDESTVKHHTTIKTRFT